MIKIDSTFVPTRPSFSQRIFFRTGRRVYKRMCVCYRVCEIIIRRGKKNTDFKISYEKTKSYPIVKVTLKIAKDIRPVCQHRDSLTKWPLLSCDVCASRLIKRDGRRKVSPLLPRNEYKSTIERTEGDLSIHI